MKEKINKENWSGEEGTFEVLKNGIVKIDDDKYTMVGFDDGEYKKIDVLSHQNKMEKIWTIFEYQGQYFAEQFGIQREGKTPAEVVAKMHWNLC